MSKPLLSKLVEIDSRFRSNKSSSSDTNFTINFSGRPELKVCHKMVIKSVSFPNVFYNINTNNNVFGWRDTTANVDNKLTVPVGQYNQTSLFSYLNTNVSAQCSAGTATFSLNTTTNLVTITFSAITGFVYGSQISGSINTMSPLGFLTVNSTSGSTTTSDSILNLIGVTECFLNSSSLGYANMLKSDDTTIPCIMKLNIDVGYGSQFIYESKDEMLDTVYCQHGGTDCSSFDIQLNDKNGNNLNLLGNPLKLVFRIYYTSVTGLIDM